MRWAAGFLLLPLIAACPVPQPLPPPAPPPGPAAAAGDRDIGTSCTQNTECTFARCDDGACAAPVDGPAPTGPVDVVLDPNGGTFVIVTDERVAVELVLPAGAVREASTVRLTPHSPTGGALLDIDVDIGGVVFLTPVSLRVQLPPGVPTPDDLWLTATNGDEQIPIAAIVDGVLEVELSSLGNGASAAPSVASPFALSRWETFALFASRLPFEEVLPVLQLLADDLEREGRVEDAAALANVIAGIVRQAVHDDDPRFVAFLEGLEDQMCARYGTALGSFEDATFACTAELEAVAAQVAAYARGVQAAGGDGECPRAQDWRAVTAAKIDELVTFIDDQDNREAWLECECTESDSPPPGCGAAGFALVPQEEWSVMLDVTSAARAGFDAFHVVGEHDEAGTQNQLLAGGLVNATRAAAFSECRNGGDMSFLGLVSQVADAPDEIRRDAQLCASALAVTVVDGAGATLATAASPNAATPGDRPGGVSVEGIRGTSVRVAGPIGTLLCRPAAVAADVVEDDVIRLDLVGSDGSVVELDTRQANGARELLVGNDAFEVDVDDALVALGIGPSDPAAFGLRVTRTTPGCGGAYEAETALFDVAIQEPLLTATILADAVTFPFSTGNTCGVPLIVTSLAADATLPVTLSDDCGSVAFSQPTNSSFQAVSTSGPQGANGGWIYDVQLTIARPGTFTATVTDEVLDDVEATLRLDPLRSDPGIFAGAPIYIDTREPIILYVGLADLPATGATATTSWHVEAGTGVLLLDAHYPNDGVAFSFSFAPD